MKPRLYPENETSFESNGLGPLSDALACTVEENRNGAFELSMEYPVTGVLFDELKHGSIIFAPPNDSSEPQPFRVYGKSTPLSGVVTVRAKHISYQLSHVPVSPFAAGSCAAALQGLKTNAVEPCPFDFWTDKETVAAFTVAEPASARSLLGGVAGSVLDVYGGEYEFDRYTVKLHKARGTDSGVVIAYGKNLVDINQEESIENTITGVYPYYKDTDGNVLELPEKVVSSASAQNFPYPRTVPLDCSQEWQETPSVEQLRAYAAAYVEKEGIGVPSVSLKVSFVPLWQTEEYKAIAPAERLNLCDIATVRFEKLGVNARAKVVQTVYDVLAGRYESVTLGEASTDLADTIVAQDKAINAKADTSDLEAAAAGASAWITGNKGGYVVLRRNADGQPYELLIMDKPTIEEATKVWRFNKSGLGYSSTGYNGTYGLAMTQDGQIVADYITTGTLSANLLRAGVLQDKTGKVFKLDLDAGTLDANFTSLQVSGKTPEQIAAEQAKEAAAAAEKAAKEAAAADLKEYQAAVEKTVQDLQDQIDGNITTWFYPYAPTAENKPASDWTAEAEREAHAGDLFYNTDPASGKAYRWAIVDDVWQWLLLEDTDVAKALANAKTAQDTADGKRRTFISTPVPPYDVGDLWAQGKDGALVACTKAKYAGQLFDAGDWMDAAGYTKPSEIRSKFALDPSSITIESGLVAFKSDTLVVDSTNFKLSKGGAVSATGKFKSEQNRTDGLVLYSVLEGRGFFNYSRLASDPEGSEVCCVDINTVKGKASGWLGIYDKGNLGVLLNAGTGRGVRVFNDTNAERKVVFYANHDSAGNGSTGVLTSEGQLRFSASIDDKKNGIVRIWGNTNHPTFSFWSDNAGNPAFRMYNTSNQEQVSINGSSSGGNIWLGTGAGNTKIILQMIDGSRTGYFDKLSIAGGAAQNVEWVWDGAISRWVLCTRQS